MEQLTKWFALYQLVNEVQDADFFELCITKLVHYFDECTFEEQIAFLAFLQSRDSNMSLFNINLN